MTEAINKFFDAEIRQVEEEDRTVVAYITTEAVDRSGEIVVAAGLSLDTYRRNPVVLRGHDRNTLVGKCEWVKHDRRGLIAKTKFADNDAGKEEWALYKGGFKKAFSIGFIPDRSQASAPVQKELIARPEWNGAKCVYRKGELFEYSTVILPCNAEAVALAYHAKSLILSPETAKELGIPDTPPVPKVYSFVSETTLKAALTSVDWKSVADEVNKDLAARLPAILKDTLHVARGGV